ncbi:MAG: radical SAM protein [Thiohalophilus sp.]
MASVSGSAVENKGVEGVAVVSGGGRDTREADQAALLPIYLATMRQRFKDEVNRLTTGGAMRRMLADQPQAAELGFPMAYLYAWHWLRHNVHEDYRARVLETFRGPRFGFLMDLLLCDSAGQFVRGYARHWCAQPAEGQKQWQEFQTLLAAREGNVEQLIQDILDIWNGLGLFTRTYMVEFKNVAREERERYAGMLGPEDEERLALVDALADDLQGVSPRYDKLGIIPAMGCPQTCRHCMFTWRPPRGKNEDPDRVFDLVDQHTDSVLFTGGDLTRQLDHFYAAIRRMRHIKNFAILLNGDFADSPEITSEVLGKMAGAIDARPEKWATAKVLLQISFDEFHNEVVVDKQGLLAERIPVARIANIVECYPRYSSQIQLALLHKQTAMNFSQDVLQKGVFARLAQELGKRGHQLQIQDVKTSPRLKRNPKSPEQLQQVLKDATFVLDKHPHSPVLLTSSTIDGYGRAALLEEWETVKEKELLQQVLSEGPPRGESFDIDMMLWFNGWVTLFNAVHICLGDLYRDGMETISARQRKDPLTQALHRFDRRLLDYYAEVRDDLAHKIDAATGPHHLFHALTEEAEVRLHMTRRLLANTPDR